jgi:ERCC4-type nuclease
VRGKDRREALQGALITIGVFYGLALLWSAGSEETARLLMCVGRQTRQFIYGGLSHPGTGQKADAHASSFYGRVCPASDRSARPIC